MLHTVNEFLEEWVSEAAITQKLLDALTDSSLEQAVTSDDRTLGRLAWHIVTSIPVTAFGVTPDWDQNSTDVPNSAKEMADCFRKMNSSITDKVKTQWTDETLKEVHQVFGRDWPLEVSLPIVIKHLIHHRGQLTVLMRQAEIKIPGVYGPTREEWTALGMEAPKI